MGEIIAKGSIMNAESRWGVRRQRTTRDLNLEILDLQKRLKLSDDVALKHAIMLREGDHRIKNSLQIVATLVDQQARRASNDSVRDALRDAVGRVRSIALIHDALQRTGGMNAVDLGDVLKTMCESLQVMAGEEGRTEVKIDAEALQMPVELARPIVLAVNELVLNALRHAFPDGRAGAVHVGVFRSDGDLCVVVGDDGVGLPDGYGAGKGYGMQLIAMMTEQAGGTLLVQSWGGARFTLRIPATVVPQPSC